MRGCGTQFRDDPSTGSGRTGSRPFPIDIEVTKGRANDRARELAAELLPNGREESGYWRTGSIADDAGQSLAVTLTGADKGMWCDHAASGPEGGGNLIQLAALVLFGGDVGKALAWLNSRLGLDGLDPDRLARERAIARARSADAEAVQAEEREQKRRNAQALFLKGQPIGGTPVEAYLATRGILLGELGRVPKSLAWHPEVTNREAGRKLPCMLASIVDLNGRYLATHRTWIAPDGKGGWGKADLEQPKMALGSFSGGFIPLWKGSCRASMGAIAAGTDVYVSEGIEDGLSAAMAKSELRVIAAVTLGNIGAIALPDQVGRLVVIGQRDTHPKTLDAMERAIGRQQEAGRDVYLTPPPAGFKDVNEALCAERSAA